MISRNYPATFFILLCSMALSSSGCRVEGGAVENPVGFDLQRGAGAFEFSTPAGATTESIAVHYQIPLLGDIDEMPVLFVFHGAERNAASYANDWSELAARHGVMVFVPEFSESDYPSSVGYQQGNLVAGNQLRPAEQWLFSLIEPMFDDVQERLGSAKVSYDAWGHSGGAQFLHRLVLFGGELRLDRAVAANAGWYTIPENDSPFPYGLDASPIDESDLAVPFGVDLLTHLGSEDTDFMETGWTGAYAQGENRFDRGQYFHARALEISQDNGILLNWNILVAEGIGHDPSGMADEAAQILYP
jgi:poly(3-hydroxybutyrate) depolymerase